MVTKEKSLIDRLIEGYTKAKKPIAYIMMILAVLATTLPDGLLPAKLEAVGYTSILLALALILMEVLFDLYEHVVTENKEVNIINSNELYSEILGIVGKDKKVRIKYIALAGRFGWQNVLEKLLNENDPNSLVSKRIQFEIEIALFDPAECKKNPMFERFDTIESTARSIKKMSELISKTAMPGSSLKMHYYDHMPNMIGFLVDDNYLFLTYTHWEHLRGELILRAGGSDYFVYDRNDRFGGQEFIRRFAGWFDFIQQKNEGSEAK